MVTKYLVPWCEQEHICQMLYFTNLFFDILYKCFKFTFIFHQVTRKQKTPQKRKDSETSPGRDTYTESVTDSYAKQSVTRDLFNGSNKLTERSQSKYNDSRKESSHNEHHVTRKQKHERTPPSGDRGAKSAVTPSQEHKRRRPRIAANLNFSPN